jgi:hypothetical protein
VEGEHQSNDSGIDHQPRAAPSRLNPCIQSFEVGVNCAAAAAAARAFWPRRGSNNRRWLTHETVQQPVNLFRPNSAKVP